MNCLTTLHHVGITNSQLSEEDSRGGSRIFEGGVAGVKYGRAPKVPVTERRRCELLGGSGGMLPGKF